MRLLPRYQLLFTYMWHDIILNAISELIATRRR